MRFGSENEPFNLVDITSETEDSSTTEAGFLSSPGNFVYETRFTVNEKEAYFQNVTGLKFEFFASKPKADAVPLKEHDFTIEIQQPPIVEKPAPENIQKAVISLKSPLMLNFAASVAPLYAVSHQQPLPDRSFKSATRTSENDLRKDPAYLLSSGKILGTTPNDVLSLGKQGHLVSNKSQNFDRVGAKSSDRSTSLFDKRASNKNLRKLEKNPMIDSFLNLKRIEQPNELVRTIPVVMAEVLSEHTEYTRQLAFEKSSLQGFSKIYVKVSGVVRKGTVANVETRNYTISHSSEVRDFLGNPDPPVILSSESSFGKVSFLLQRNDPALRKVSVVRITKNPNLSRSLFENVGIVEFSDVDVVEFQDSVDNVAPNTVIYRFVVQNEDGSSGEFVSSVLNSFTKVTSQQKVLTSTTPISIRALNTSEGINISVDTINDQVYSLRLLRQDLGAMGEFSDTVKTIRDSDNRYSQIVAGERKTLSFLDTEVALGRHYRYFAAYRLGSGAEASLCQETVSDEDEVIVRYVASNNLPFAADISSIITSQDETNSTVIEFDVTVREVEEQYNTLLDALQQAGVSQQFIIDLQNDRQKARQVAAFLVERVDRVTGRRCSFGIVSPGKFSDSPAVRAKLGIPDPLPGRKYEYICKLCIRPPSTFLITATVGFRSAGDAPGDITEVLAAKFQNALIGRGVLPSEKQLRDGFSIRDNFFMGLTGLEISAVTTLPQFGPKVENINIKEKSIYTLVRWSTSGDVSEISYFLVYCNYNGVDELLGTVSSIGKNSTYQYKDTRFHNEVGQKTYFVKMVTLDHDVSIPSPKVEVITNFSIPEAVLDGYILSPSRYEVKGSVLRGPGPSFPPQSAGVSQQIPIPSAQTFTKTNVLQSFLPKGFAVNQPFISNVASPLGISSAVIAKQQAGFSPVVTSFSAGVSGNGVLTPLVTKLPVLGLSFNPAPVGDSLFKLTKISPQISSNLFSGIQTSFTANAGISSNQVESSNTVAPGIPGFKGFI